MDDALTPSEELALVGLLRLMIRLDGRGTPEEAEAYRTALLQALATDDQGDVAPYREAPAAPLIDEARLATLEERADRELSTDESVRNAALAVTRQGSRETIFAALSDVAASDGVHVAEIALLDWLADLWSIEVHEAPDAP